MDLHCATPRREESYRGSRAIRLSGMGRVPHIPIFDDEGAVALQSSSMSVGSCRSVNGPQDRTFAWAVFVDPGVFQRERVPSCLHFVVEFLDFPYTSSAPS